MPQTQDGHNVVPLVQCCSMNVTHIAFSLFTTCLLSFVYTSKHVCIGTCLYRAHRSERLNVFICYLLFPVCFADLHASVKLPLYYGCIFALRDSLNKKVAIVTPVCPFS
ncbi:hypothetical protein GOODEAATRI_034494 [Goodea atripinnis]|uniref:Uncharacterized protein n=1 Tax=Goodea atripinnis TaxID=208336 RepID=A0ABV0PUF3_9TELE